MFIHANWLNNGCVGKNYDFQLYEKIKIVLYVMNFHYIAYYRWLFPGFYLGLFRNVFIMWVL